MPLFLFMKKPLFITAGDPLGIGPEIVVKALQQMPFPAGYQPFVIGEYNTLQKVGFSNKLATLIPIETNSSQPLLPTPAPTKWGGEISFKAFQLGCKLAQKYKVPLVTAPISKQSWAMANIPYTGHTEFLRQYYGKNALMLFTSGKLCCALVTEHFAISDLGHIITKERIIKTASTLANFLIQKGIKSPSIAICALNPHAGDNGKFGNEEQTIITPAINELKNQNLNVEGPFPVDSLWATHIKGKYDAIVCMYHDQALLPLKVAVKQPVVHITAGLSITRLSPTHGTAFDIAGKNIADPSSMISAIKFVARI